jgi:hypothetical protein
MADKITANDLLAADVIKEFQKLNKELKASVDAMALLSKSSISLNKELKETANTQDKLSNSTEKVKKEKIQLSQAEKDLTRIEQLQKKLIEQTAGSYNQLSTKLNLLRAQYRNMNDEQRKSSGKGMLKEIQGLDKQLKDFDKTMGQSQRNVGNYGSAFNGVKTKILGFIGILAGGNIALKAFNSIVGSAQTLGDAWQRNLEGIKTGLGFVANAIATFDFSNFFTGLRNAIQAGKDYADTMDDLADTQRSLQMRESDLARTILEKKRIVRSALSTDKEAIQAANDIIAIEDKLAIERGENAKIELDATLNKTMGIIGSEKKLAEIDKRVLLRLMKTPKLYKNQIEIGEKYNAMIAERDGLQASLFSGEQQYDETMMARFNLLNEQIKKATSTQIYWGRAVSNFNSVGDDQRKVIADLYSQVKTAENTALENTQRVAVRRDAILAERSKKETKANDDEIKLQEKLIELQLKLNSIRSEELANLDEKNAAFFGTDEKEQSIEDTLKEEEKLLEDYFKKESDLADIRVDKAFKTADAIIEKEKEVAQVRQEIIGMQADMISGLGELTNTVYDGQLQRLEENKQKELLAAGDNAKKKEKIEKEYAQKSAAIKRKQAVVEKISALFQIALNTAMGVTNALSKVVTTPLVPWIIANGAIQAAIVAARPIPKFAKGVKNFTGGEAVVGDAGYEALKTPDGNVFLTPDKATRMVLPKGTDVFTHNETKEMLSNGVSIDKFDEMIREQKQTRKALASQVRNSTNITPKGWIYTQEQVNSRKIFIDKYFRG